MKTILLKLIAWAKRPRQPRPIVELLEDEE